MVKEFVATEYEQICESYNDHRRIFIQVVVLLAVADVSIIGYAVSEKNFSVFLFGGITMWILFRANVRIANMTLVVVLRGLKLERMMGVTGLMHYIAAAAKGKPAFIDVVTEGGLFDVEKDELRVVAELQRKFKRLSLRYDVPFALSNTMGYVILILAALQLSLGIWGFVTSGS